MYNIQQVKIQQAMSNQTREQKVISSDFIFCHCPTSLKDVIMLANHNQILNKIIKDATEPYYFWIYQEVENIQDVIKQISHNIQNTSNIFTSIQQVQNLLHVEKNRAKYKKIILITHPERQQQFFILTRRNQFIGALFYDPNQNQEEKSKQKINKNQFLLNIKQVYCKTKRQLNKFLNSNQWNLSELKELVNFVLLRQQVQKSTALYRTMMAMLNDQISIQTKNKIVNEFQKFGRKLIKFHPKLRLSNQYFEQALKQLKRSSMTLKQILRMYTSENYQMYIFMNSFLRAMSCPTQIYYIQPLFKKLFEAVKELYQSSPDTQFICYRGGFVSAEEFFKLCQATGEIVQNLGFFSTSSNFETARNFQSNILFEIQVRDLKKSENIAPGFGNISLYSEFFLQRQILFNPMNHFKILQTKNSTYKQSVEQQSFSEYQLLLRYEDRSHVSNEDENEHETIAALLILQDEIGEKIKSQRDVILQVENISQFKIAEIYFEFFERKVNQLVDITSLLTKMENNNCIGINRFKQYTKKIKRQSCIQQLLIYLQAATKMGYIESFFGKEQNALSQLQRLKNIYQKVVGEKHPGYLKALSNIAICFMRLGKLPEALNQMSLSADLRKEILGEKHPDYIISLNGIGIALYQLDRYEQALRYHLLCQSLGKEVLGQKHPFYLNNMSNISITLLRLGRYEEALSLNRKYANMRRNILGQGHPSCISSLSKTANALLQLGYYQESLNMQQQCATKMALIWGDKHPEYFKRLQNIGLILFKLNRKEEALQMYRICQQGLEVQDPSYIQLLGKIQSVLSSLERRREAFEMLKLVRNNKIILPTNPLHHTLFRIIVCLCLCLGQYEELCRTLFELPASFLYRFFASPQQILLRLQTFPATQFLLKLLITYIESNQGKFRAQKRSNMQRQIKEYKDILMRTREFKYKNKMRSNNAISHLIFLFDY